MKRMMACLTELRMEGEVNAARGAKAANGWTKISVAVDSGAAESVIPLGLVGNWEVVPHERPIFYQSATGEPMENKGAQMIPMIPKAGGLRPMTFQATKCTTPLGSVKRLCEHQHAVVFLPEEYGPSAILNLKTGTIDYLREEEGNYMLDAWIPPPDASADSQPPEEGFGRPR